MYNYFSKHYIFKKSSGKIFGLSFDKKNGIFYSSLTKKNLWTMPMSLEKQSQESFGACMDSKDIFHVIYQNSYGNIFYMKLDENSLSTLPILSSKHPSPYNKYFKIISIKNSLHCFYVLHHNNKCLLTHQVILDGDIKNPQALGYINNNNLPYAAYSTRQGDIYIFYQVPPSSDLQQKAEPLQIGYRKYSSSNQIWEEFAPIPSVTSEFDYPCALIDNSDIIHFCYNRLVADRYELLYRQKAIDSNDWSSETMIHSSVNTFENSSIIYIDSRLIIFWVRNDIIYYSFSVDKGNSWSKPIRYNFSSSRQLNCISYSTNDLYEINRILINEIPGSFINGIKLAFYEDLFSAENIYGVRDEVNNMIFDNLKILSQTLDDLAESNNSIKADIKRLKLFNTNILREMDKLSIKISYLENQVLQQKVITKKVSELDTTQQNLTISDFIENQEQDSICSQSFTESNMEINENTSIVKGDTNED